MHDPPDLISLFLRFATLSLFAVGGASAAVPEMHRQFVDVAHWLTDREFTALFAMAQAAPGPNVMFVALLGHYFGGVPGALVATVGMCGPTCVLAWAVSRVFDRFRTARWRIAIQSGLVPVTIGLIAASAFVIARAADRGLVGYAITAVTFALVQWTRVSPLFAFAAAALFGLFGLV